MKTHRAKLISGFCGVKQTGNCLALDETPVHHRLTPSAR